MVFSILLFGLAAILNAVMDTLTYHFSTSIFKKLNPNFWNPEVSWKTAKYLPLTKYKLDEWHLAKSGMIISLALSLTTALIPQWFFYDVWWFYLVFFLILGVVWNGLFNLFYNSILR